MFSAKKCLMILAVLGMLLFPIAAAVADWDPSMPTKWVQMPDESPNGMDVNATWQSDATGAGVWPFVKVLADDFPCEKAGPITDIHVWGSWLFDDVDPNAVFKLSIHDDVPAGVDAEYSHPVLEPRWEKYFEPGSYVDMPWSTGPEQFYDPNQDEIIGMDNQMWLYNFLIPESEAFFQEGGGKIYWLDVQVMTNNNSVFGWKTTTEPWNDDAVFADTECFGGPPVGPAPPPVFWQDMHYPIGHPYEGQSIDLAFAITTIPEPGTLVLLITAGMGLLLFAWRRRK